MANDDLTGMVVHYTAWLAKNGVGRDEAVCVKFLDGTCVIASAWGRGMGTYKGGEEATAVCMVVTSCDSSD